MHIPLCVRKCNYCDFCSYPLADADWRDGYINKICAEIESYKGNNIIVDTLFFGGGTPSLLSSDEFLKIYSSINNTFILDNDAEITLETNPKTLTPDNLKTFLSCGVNRLSIGLQSIHDNETKILGRIHNFDDFMYSFELAKTLGVGNINVDLMYGIPEQTMYSFAKTLDTVLALKPEHISLYGLILEEGTPFWKMKNSLSLPGEDTECDMYYHAADILRYNGYSHYEISNYAKDGYASRHNMKYWLCEEYIGVGVSAYSYFNGERYGNSSHISEYLSENCKKYSYREKATRESEMYEYVMLGLRLKDGFSLKEYSDKFDVDFVNRDRMARIDQLVDLGYMIKKDDRLSLTERGFYISNSILTDLI